MAYKATLKTKKNNGNVEEFLISANSSERLKDCLEIMQMMQEITGEKPVMWGASIVGFGKYHYVYKSGREGDWFLTGFSPRKQNLSLYIMSGFDRYEDLMNKLGKFKTGKGCLYIKSLADIDRSVLHELISKSTNQLKTQHAV